DGVIDERDPPLEYNPNVDNISGFQIQVGKQIGGKFGIALTGWFPSKRLYRLSNIEPSLPNYFSYENQPQRYVLAAGMGGEIVRGVNVGISADVVTKADLTLHGTLGVKTTSPNEPDDTISDLITEVNIDMHDIKLDLGYAIIPVVGVQFEVGRWTEALDGLVVGATFRPRKDVSINAALDIQANVDIQDIGDLDPFIMGAIVSANASLYDYHSPAQLGVGVAWRTDQVFNIYGDVVWSDWSKAKLNVTNIKDADIIAPLIRIDDVITDGNLYTVELRSTITARTGMELHMPKIVIKNKLKYLRYTVRGGFAYVQTPLVAQGPNSAFLDTDRIMVTLGSGVEFWDPFELVDAPVRFDIFAQYNQIGTSTLQRSTDVPLAGFPRDASGIPVGGNILIVGGQWGFDY
ncbi:MAG: hypothetical protein ACI9MC_003703, partial [Kiritimatiellia bacterium]